MTWVLIRHGQTQGNLEKRYIGCKTDEPLCREGIKALEKLSPPLVSRVFASPMKRCLETARLLYPGVPVTIIPDFRECDFGAFENKNYEELKDQPDYQKWLDSMGEMPFPGGESRKEFSLRCIRAFESMGVQKEDCALIVHGGTIMAIMEHLAHPKGSYYDFQCKNGAGFLLFQDGSYRPIP